MIKVPSSESYLAANYPANTSHYPPICSQQHALIFARIWGQATRRPLPTNPRAPILRVISIGHCVRYSYIEQRQVTSSEGQRMAEQAQPTPDAAPPGQR